MSPPAPAPYTRPVFEGDISPAVQDEIASFSKVVMEKGAFARSTGSSLVLTEVGVFQREKDGKAHARITYQTTVHEGTSSTLPSACWVLGAERVGCARRDAEHHREHARRLRRVHD